MPSKYLYLLIDFASISIPLLWSFEKKVNFIQYWKAILGAIFLTMVLFIPWDIYFTHIGVWGFNDAYLTGISLLRLPVEEWLFFICIPYASIFTHEALKYYLPFNPSEKVSKITTYLLFAILIIFIGFGYSNWYTLSASVLALIVLIVLKFVIKSKNLSRFYFSYLVILIPFFIVNGILTGSITADPIVWYNDVENLGIRLGTIPIEDTVYGFSLLIINISLFEWLKSKKEDVK